MSAGLPVRAAIVGLGRWGQALVDAAAGAPGCRLRFTRATTRSPGKVTDFCARHGLLLSPDLETVLACDDLDAVVLATPHSQHADQIRAVAARELHVFVEKPLALTLDDARAAVVACDTGGVHLAVGFNRRFLPAFRNLQRQLAEGRIGRPLHAEASFCGPWGYGYSDEMWRGSPAENPAGGMAAMGIHMLDAMISAFGTVRRVSVVSRRLAVDSGLDDTTNVHLDFASGATGSLSTLMATAPFWRLHVFGSQGWLQMPDQNRLVSAVVDGDGREQAFAPVDTLSAELDAFADAVRGGRDYPVSAAQALAGVAAMEAIGHSARQDGAWVDVAETTLRAGVRDERT